MGPTTVVSELDEIAFNVFFLNVSDRSCVHENLILWTQALDLGDAFCSSLFVFVVQAYHVAIDEIGCLLEFADITQTSVTYIEPTVASASVHTCKSMECAFSVADVATCWQ